MHSLGNDFVIFDTIRQNAIVSPTLIRHIADRHCGIGCDQVLLVGPPFYSHLDFHYRIFNANGKEVTQCGNGARCFGRYVFEQGLTNKKLLKIGTLSGKMKINLHDLSAISVEIGVPQFAPAMIPLNSKKVTSISKNGRYKIHWQGNERVVHILSLGNPHCVMFVSSLQNVPVTEVGQALQRHPAFPEGVNVSFVQLLARNHIQCRVFERDVGETQACGSAACAAVAAGILQGELSREVQVSMPGGNLTVSWPMGKSILLSGPTKMVFQGTFCSKRPELLR